MLFEYIYIFIYLAIGFILGLVVLLLPLLTTVRYPEIEKISAYECGFHPFEDTRSQFEVRFYLVAILFIIFDLEIMFLYPWIVICYKLALPSIVLMYLFLVILTIGFVYEWRKGALEWE